MIEDIDYLKEMFECYFRFRKTNSELPIERLSDAIIGALSGADYPKVVRANLLSNLISDCDIIKRTTEIVQTLREQIQSAQTIIAPTTIIKDTRPSSDWLEINELCQMFKLPKNNIKSKKWRDDNHFPYHQACKGAKTTFNKKEVEEWVNSYKH